MLRRQCAASMLCLAGMVACSTDERDSGLSTAPGVVLAKAPAVGDPTATFSFPLADAALNVKSDGQYIDGAMSVYAHGVCGVDAKIFATLEASNSGDAIMQTNNPRYSSRKCPVYPRTLTVLYPDGFSETASVFINVRQIANTTFSIPVGTTVNRSFALNPAGSPRCEKLLWSSEQQGSPIAADSVAVTRVAPDTWRVQTQAPPNNRAFCTTNGESYNLALDFTITSSRALP